MLESILMGGKFKPNNYTPMPKGPTARRGYQSCVGDNKLFIYGGYDGNPRGDLWQFDFLASSWTLLSTHSTDKRCYGEMTYYNGKLIVYGGSSDNGNTRIGTVLVYDIANNTWSTGTSGVARSLYMADIFGKWFYVAGGFTNGGQRQDMVKLDLDSLTWTNISTTALSPGLNSGAGAMHTADWLVIFGGTRSSVTAEVAAYNTLNGSKNAWTTMPTATRQNSVTKIGNKFYICFNQGWTDRLDIFDPDTYGWTSKKLGIGIIEAKVHSWGGHLYIFSGRYNSSINPDKLTEDSFLKFDPAVLQDW